MALTFVPAVFTQDVEDVKVMAFQHSSLAGCANELVAEATPSTKNIVMITGYRK